MAALLKNVFFTALLVAAATVATVTIASTLAIFMASPPTTNPPPPAALAFALLLVVGMAMLIGMLFCVVTLFMTAITMPPVLWAARRFDLPRPLVDMIGGALVAWFCAQAGAEEADSLAAYGLV